MALVLPLSHTPTFPNRVREFFSLQSPIPVRPKSDGMIGAGVIHRHRHFITHTTLPHHQSALITLKFWQKAFLVLLLVLLVWTTSLSLYKTSLVLIALLSTLYFVDMFFNLNLILRSLHFPPEIKIKLKEILSLRSDELPIYTILCPLYKEAKVLPQFIQAVKNISWPKQKLEVLLLLEEDDSETLQAVNQIKLPHFVKTLIVPPSQPRTKPKACNFGLSHAKGKYIVIYDAEDVPDKHQLKKAYLAFSKVGPEVVCLQAKLNYYNPHHNLLTKLFTAEYSLWFDVILPGLQSINTTIPLGGTSNHFQTANLKRLHGWDPFNVTEDCDLGVRLFKTGLKTAMFNSTTLEEANSDLHNWLRQRSRWIKGYIQTYFVHMRSPLRFTQDHGIHAIIFQLIIGMKVASILINPILWMATIAYFSLYSLVGPTIESLYPPMIFYMAGSSLVFGNFMYLYHYMIGCAKRQHWGLIKYVYLVPFYWLLMSIAALIALIQLIFKPHFWEKTHHGLHLAESEASEKEVSSQPAPAYQGDNLKDIKLHSKNTSAYISVRSSLAINLQALRLLLRPFTPPVADPSKPRLIIFNWRDIKHVWSGGAEVYIHQIAKRWVKQGNQVILFTSHDGQQPDNEIVDGIHIIRRGGFYTVYFWAILYYLFQIRSQADLVIDCANGVPFFTPLYARKPKIFLIHHVHQQIFVKHLKPPLSWLAILIESKLTPLLYHRIPAVTVSDSSRQDFIKQHISRPELIRVIFPGIDPVPYRPILKTNHPSFIYLGRLKHYKNIDQAIKAFSVVVKSYPKARFSIAGRGENLEELQQLVRDLNLEDSVTFYDFVSEQQKDILLKESWISLQPSSFEGWGITVIESNARGTPVIASAVSGLRDSVLDGVTGLLVPPRRPDYLAQAMIHLVREPYVLRRLSHQATIWANNFSWDVGSQQFYQLIERELARVNPVPLSVYPLNFRSRLPRFKLTSYLF
ncbi:glycosyltransferase [Candidatus Collierbacteria bacterium]|nr:glycosyltransferase [Candidatus Collierbacteria bacterium]